VFPNAYDELRKLAVDALFNERPNHTLQPTALIHEAFLKLMASCEQLDMDIASASVGPVPVGATTGSYMVAASRDPAWASQTEIGNKNDTLEEAVFQC